MPNPEVTQRLKSIEGHVRGVERMVEEDAYCIDILRQLDAIHAAMNRVSALILDHHLNTCVITAVRGDDPAERERVLEEIAELYQAARKG